MSPTGVLHAAVGTSSVSAIYRVDPALGTATLYSGGATPCSAAPCPGDGGLAASAQYMAISAMAFDSAGTLYVADSLANQIRAIDANGNVRTVLNASGTVCTCSAATGCCGDGGPSSAATARTPSALVAVGTTLYFAMDGGLVRKIDAAGNVSTVAGSWPLGTTCSGGACGDGGAATAGKLGNPISSLAASGGALYVGEATRRIRKIDANGGLGTFAGTGVACSSTTCGLPSPPLQAPLTDPRLLWALGTDDLILVDANAGTPWAGRLTSSEITPVAGFVQTDQSTFDVLPGRMSALKSPAGIAPAGPSAVFVSVQKDGVPELRRIDF